MRGGRAVEQEKRDSVKSLGKALRLIDIINQAGAELVGIGIVIEKGFQDGGKSLREKGIDLYSLAIVDEMSPEGIKFRR